MLAFLMGCRGIRAVWLLVAIAIVMVCLLAPAMASAAGEPRVMYGSHIGPDGLWTAELNGTNQQLFYEGGYGPSWSENGSKVVFETGSPTCYVGAEVGEIYVMYANGSELTPLAFGCNAHISPNGQWVVYQPGPDEVAVIEAKLGAAPIVIAPVEPANECERYFKNHFNEEEEKIFDSCEFPEEPAWLGNEKVVFVGGLAYGLWTIPRTGGTITEVPGTGRSESNITWLNGIGGSYDGKTIAAGGYLGTGGGENLYSVPGGGGSPTLLAAAPNFDFQYIDPAFSFDNKKIVFEDYDREVFEDGHYKSTVEVIGTGGGTPTLVSGSDTTAEHPSFAPPASGGTILGKVTNAKGEGLAEATITVKSSGSGETKVTQTDSTGTYSVDELEPGNYTVTPSGVPKGQSPAGTYDTKVCPGAKGSQPASCTVDVGAGADTEVSFSYGAFKLTGKVTFRAEKGEEEKPAKNVPIEAKGPESKTATTNEKGEYELALESGTYQVSIDKKFEPKAIQSSGCAASGGTCTVELTENREADFNIGCQPELDYHTSMIAVGCFLPDDPAKGTWRARGSFRMDGIDFESSDDKTKPVIFNEQTKAVDGEEVRFSFSAPGWGSEWASFFIPGGLHMTFPFTEQHISWAFTTPWKTPGSLATKVLGFLAAPVGGTPTIFGFPAHAPAFEINWTAGQTVINAQLSFPPSNKAWLDPINGLWKGPNEEGKIGIKYPIAFRAKITANNKVGVSNIVGSFSPSAVYGILKGVDEEGNPTEKIGRTPGVPTEGTIELARIGFNWELEKGVFAPTALIVVHNSPSKAAWKYVKPLSGFLGRTLVTVEAGFKWLTSYEVFGSSVAIPGLVRVAFNVNNINKYIPDTPGFFWQRWGIKGGIDPTNPLGAVELGGSLGFTWLPRFKSDYLWFTEVLSLDGEGNFTFDPFSFKGGLELKGLGATLMRGQARITPENNLEYEGELGLNLNQILRVGFPAQLKGTGKLVVPEVLTGWYFSGMGLLNVWSFAGNGEFLLNEHGAGFCVSSNKTGRKGAYFDGQWHVGGCEGGPFGGAKGAGATSSPSGGESGEASAAAVGRAFVLTGRSRVSAVAVAGRGAAPKVAVEGPGGLRLEIPLGAEADISSPASLVTLASDSTTYILFAHDEPGRYRIVPLAGSAPISSVKFSAVLAPPSVSARVRPVGCQRQLTWRLKPQPGQHVELFEQGSEGSKAILSTDARSGSHLFSPLVGASPASEIVAHVEQQGTPRATLVLAHFAAPTGTEAVADLRGQLKIGKRGKQTVDKLALAWKPVCGANRYVVAVGSGEEPTLASVRGTHTSVTVSAAALGKHAKSIPVAVTAVGLDGRLGKTSKILLVEPGGQGGRRRGKRR